MLKLWIQSRVDLTHKIYPRSYLKTTQQQQAYNQPSINLQRVSILQSLNTLDSIEVTHEGTNDVKRDRKHTLIQAYEMFRMLKGESIAEVQKRFTHIINHLMSLGKTFDKEELNIKILKCLDRTWQPKVTTIS